MMHGAKERLQRSAVHTVCVLILLARSLISSSYSLQRPSWLQSNTAVVGLTDDIDTTGFRTGVFELCLTHNTAVDSVETCYLYHTKSDIAHVTTGRMIHESVCSLHTQNQLNAIGIGDKHSSVAQLVRAMCATTGTTLTTLQVAATIAIGVSLVLFIFTLDSRIQPRRCKTLETIASGLCVVGGLTMFSVAQAWGYQVIGSDVGSSFVHAILASLLANISALVISKCTTMAPVVHGDHIV